VAELGLVRRVTLIMMAIELITQQPLRFGFAWVLLSLALTLHVIDEALTDFLSVYNPAVPSDSQARSLPAVANLYVQSVAGWTVSRHSRRVRFIVLSLSRQPLGASDRIPCRCSYVREWHWTHRCIAVSPSYHARSLFFAIPRRIYTAHVHRRDGSDMGLFDRLTRSTSSLKDTTAQHQAREGLVHP